MQLVCAHALLRSGHEIEAHKPLVQRNMTGLHHTTGGDAKIFAAFLLAATIHPGLFGLVGGSDRAAMNAGYAIWPADVFNELAGCIGVLKVRLCEHVHRSALLVGRY